jgi:hypothetical protein
MNIEELRAKYPITPVKVRQKYGPRLKDLGVIYFIKGTDTIKIGFATVFEKRLSAAICWMSSPPVVLGLIPGTLEMEGMLHYHLRNLKVHHEHFRYCPELLKLIDKMVHYSKKRFDAGMNRVDFLRHAGNCDVLSDRAFETENEIHSFEIWQKI